MSQPFSDVDATLLEYRLSLEPDPMRIGAPGTLRLTARGGTHPVFVRKITLNLPIGTGATDLTNTPNDIRRPPVAGGDHAHQGDGWTMAAPSGGAFAATPTRARGWILGVTPLTLTLADIPVNNTTGTAVLEVTEESSLDGTTWQPRTTRLPLGKFPANFIFRDFHPAATMVHGGGHAELSWRGSPAEYTLTWSGQSGGRGGSAQFTEGGTWTSPALYDTTVFRLAAKMPGSTAERVHTTMVTVARPHLTINNLTTVDSVQLMGASQPVQHVTLGTVHTFTAGTDGTLLGRLQANAGGTPTAITVTAKSGGSVEYANVFVSDNADTRKLPTETSFHVPVRRHAEITCACRHHPEPPARPEDPVPYFSLTWIPDGDAIRLL